MTPASRTRRPRGNAALVGFGPGRRGQRAGGVAPAAGLRGMTPGPAKGPHARASQRALGRCRPQIRVTNGRLGCRARPRVAYALPMESRDRYPDALRAGALLVVVLGHWVATLPRLVDGRLAGTDHLLATWDAAGVITWVVQVVPLFVFVSAAVSAPGVARRLDAGQSQLRWWARRALGLARPAVTYLAVLAALALLAMFTGGRLLEAFNTSLTIHLWFLLMLLGVQALLPLAVRADRRFGLGAVAALILVAAAADLLRAGLRGPADLLELGARVRDSAPGAGWVNMLAVRLLPQQLGIAWKQGRFGGPRAGLALLALGVAWLAAAIASGY